MPTAVVQIDVEATSLDILVPPHYDRAYVLVRRRGSPVAQFYAPVRNGRLDVEATRLSLESVLTRHRWHWKVDDYVGEPAVPPLPAATVAVCTRERPDDLTRALHAISALDPAPREVLVVDNNPATDRTYEVVASFPGVRYVREDRPGLDAARNRALTEAMTPHQSRRGCVTSRNHSRIRGSSARPA